MNTQSIEEPALPATLGQAQQVIAELRAIVARQHQAEEDAQATRSALDELRDAAACVIGHPHNEGTLRRYARANDRARRVLENRQPGHHDRYLIWSQINNAWWRPKSAGYTNKLPAAGVYTAVEAAEICRTARDGFADGGRPTELPVRLADIGTMLFRGTEASFGGAPWRCPTCGDFNHDARASCRRCPTPRPGGAPQ